MATDKDYEEAPIIRISFSILQGAIDRDIKEILIQPQRMELSPPSPSSPNLYEVQASVQYLTSEGWQEAMVLPGYVRVPLTARFRVMSGLLPLASDEPQEGRIPLRSANRDYMVYTRTEPTELGESIHMRIETEKGK